MVSTEIKNLANCKKELKITVPADQIKDIREEQIKVVQKEAEISGFRKGRAPKHMVQKLYAATIDRYTIDEALEVGFHEGIKESNVVPFGQPLVKNFNYDEKNNLLMEVEVETYPEIELKKYKGLKIEKIIYNINDEDVDDQIELIRKQKATIIPIEEKAQEGHYITIDMQELDDSGMPLVGKKYNDIRIELGKGSFDNDIEEQLLGAKLNEEIIVEKRYPQGRSGGKGSKKYERFKVFVKRIEQEELPELNDEFVTALNININSVDELKRRVKEQLEFDWGQRSEQHFYNQLAHELLQENPFEVPESMVSVYLDQIVADIGKRDKTIDIEDVRRNYRVDALFNIKWFHLKQKIAEVEKIKVEEKDYTEYLQKIEDNRLRNRYRKEKELKKRIQNDLFERKIFDFLVANSEVSVKEQAIKKRKELESV